MLHERRKLFSSVAVPLTSLYGSPVCGSVPERGLTHLPAKLDAGKNCPALQPPPADDPTPPPLLTPDAAGVLPPPQPATAAASASTTQPTALWIVSIQYSIAENGTVARNIYAFQKRSSSNV